MSNVLLGCAIADSLGVPFESKPANYPPLLEWDQKTFLGSEYHNLKPGQFSDDSQMQQMIAESLLSNKGFNPDDLAERYVDWIFSGKARGYGKTTLQAITNLKNGVSYKESGCIGSLGNGVAMRASPFSVFFRKDKKALIEAVKIDNAMTHRSEESEAGALAMALTVFYILNRNTKDLQFKLLPDLPESAVKAKILNLSTFLKYDVNPLSALKVMGTRADVRETVPSALYCFLKCKNYEEGVVTAIRSGFDTDTTAACVGSLFGAKNGFKRIPEEWIKNVEDSDKLIKLDSELFNAA